MRKGDEQVAAHYPDHHLFLCWPTYNKPMAFRALQAYQGNRLVYIGEGSEGCTGDEAFFDLLEQEWHLVEQRRGVSWSGIRDSIMVYERGPEEER